MSGAESLNANVLIFSEPISLGGEKLEFDQAVFDAIPKNYVFTENDSIIELAQKKYARRDNMTKNRLITSGHLPMITHSEILAQAILDLVKSEK